MSRSGTSAVASIVAALGADIGPQTSLIPPNEFNAGGYWEQRPIYNLNTAILAALGGTYESPPSARRLGRRGSTAHVSRLVRPAWRHPAGDVRPTATAEELHGGLRSGDDIESSARAPRGASGPPGAAVGPIPPRPLAVRTFPQ